MSKEINKTKETVRKLIKEGYCYVARDEDGMLCAFKSKPIKCPSSIKGEGQWVNNWVKLIMEDDIFEDVSWEDSAPVVITDMFGRGDR